MQAAPSSLVAAGNRQRRRARSPRSSAVALLDAQLSAHLAPSPPLALGRRALEAFRPFEAKGEVSGDGNNASLLSLGGCNGGGGDAAGVGETWDN